MIILDYEFFGKLIVKDEKNKVCPNCGKEVLIEAKICKYCKTNVESKKCPYCSELVFKSDITCNHCGSILKKSLNDYKNDLNKIKSNKKTSLAVRIIVVIAGLVIIFFLIKSTK